MKLSLSSGMAVVVTLVFLVFSLNDNTNATHSVIYEGQSAATVMLIFDDLFGPLAESMRNLIPAPGNS